MDNDQFIHYMRCTGWCTIISVNLLIFCLSIGDSMRKILKRKKKNRTSRETLGQHAGLVRPDKKQAVAEKMSRFK